MPKKNTIYDFLDKVVLITGAAQGIGEATATAFAKAGANLILVDLNQENLFKLKKDLECRYNNVKILTLKVNVANQEEVSFMVKDSIEKFGRIDILFNNAGIVSHCPLEKVTLEEWRKIMSVNLDGAFLVAQYVGREMIKKQKGKIINAASMSGFIVNENRFNSVYCISKAAVIMLTKTLAVEWAKYNIDVNAIAPGYTKTPLIIKSIKDPKIKESMEERVPLHRLAEPHEIANTVLFLASDDTTYVNGHILYVDGGYTIW